MRAFSASFTVVNENKYDNLNIFRLQVHTLALHSFICLHTCKWDWARVIAYSRTTSHSYSSRLCVFVANCPYCVRMRDDSPVSTRSSTIRSQQ